MSFLESAKKQFADYLAESLLYVELEGIDGRIYYRPVRAMNTPEADMLRKLSENQTSDALLDILIFRARNADGTKMFKPDQKDDLRYNLGAQVVARVVTLMSQEKGAEPDIKKFTIQPD